MTSPDRLFFDIEGAKPEMVSKGMHVIAVGDGLLKQIRIAETQPGVTRVVLDLEQRAEFTASQLADPNRLMIELKLKDRPAPPATGSVSGAKSDHGIAGTSRGRGSRSAAAGSRSAPDGCAPRVRGPGHDGSGQARSGEAGAATV